MCLHTSCLPELHTLIELIAYLGGNTTFHHIPRTDCSGYLFYILFIMP